MSDWVTITMDEAGHLENGAVPYFSGATNYLATADVVGYKKQPSEEVTYSSRPSRAQIHLALGDVLQAKMRETNKSFVVDSDTEGWIASTGFARFRPERVGNLPLYIYYIVTSDHFLRERDKLCVGSTQQAISDRDLRRILVTLPRCVREQKRIARILQIIDWAVERTEALIDKYQQIKAGLMHDLFTRGIGPDGQLRPPREQAPELYQETPIGWMPKEWSVKPLKEGFDANPKNGFSPKEVDTWQGLYVLGLSCLTKSGFKPLKLKKSPKSAIASGALLQDGDFLISRSNTPDLVGLCGIYKDVGDLAIYPDLMVRLRLNSDIDPNFLEKYLLTSFSRNRISAIAVGTSGSMVKINGSDIREFRVPFPSTDEQRVITEKLEPIDHQIFMLESRHAKLQKQKSGLMHDLLTGRVRVKPEDEPGAAHV